MRKLFNITTVVLVFFSGFSAINAQETSAVNEVQNCQSTSKGTRCKTRIALKTVSPELLIFRHYSLKTENNCQESSRGTRCKQRQSGFSLLKGREDQQVISRSEICRYTARGTRCNS